MQVHKRDFNHQGYNQFRKHFLNTCYSQWASKKCKLSESAWKKTKIYSSK